MFSTWVQVQSRISSAPPYNVIRTFTAVLVSTQLPLPDPSNVLQGLHSCFNAAQAEYDAASQQFILNTPDDEASKFWIGGAGQHGKICTVFAQLTVNGRWEGPHVFVVRLRDDAGNLAPGALPRSPCARLLAVALHVRFHTRQASVQIRSISCAPQDPM